MSYGWGPHYVIPTKDSKTYSGVIQLREYYDLQLLNWELDVLGLPKNIRKVNNPWYCRPKNSTTWVKIGESDKENENFSVPWNTLEFANGVYEVMGLMHVFVIDSASEKIIAGQNIVEVEVKN
jgi:hypothetical protein